MGELTNATRETLAAEARKRIKSRNGEKGTLAYLYDKLILSSLRVFDAYDKSRPFYKNGSRIDYDALVSVAIDSDGPEGVLRQWQALVYTPKRDLSACPPTAEQHAAIIKTTHAIEELMYAIAGKGNDCRIDLISGKWWTKEHIFSFEKHFWDFLKLTVRVNIREIDILFEHHKEWLEDWNGVDSPVLFTRNVSIEEQRRLWESVKSMFDKYNPISTLWVCDSFLSTKIADLPRAFCFEDSDCSPINIGNAAEKALQLDYVLRLNYNETMMWTSCHSLARATKNTTMDIIQYFRRARAMCAASSSAHRKWLEAEAEAIAHYSLEDESITPAVAEHIITLANDAAREQWIETRMKSNTSDKDAKVDQMLSTVVNVHLDDTQMDELIACSARTGARIERKLVTVQKTVNGEHIKVNEKSRANTKRVKDAIGRYYKLVKDGTKERMATTDACRETESKMGLGDYKSFNAFRGAVAREIAERKRRYGDRAASVSLDE